MLWSDNHLSSSVSCHLLYAEAKLASHPSDEIQSDVPVLPNQELAVATSAASRSSEKRMIYLMCFCGDELR
jgi:hypothetical protein